MKFMSEKGGAEIALALFASVLLGTYTVSHMRQTRATQLANNRVLQSEDAFYAGEVAALSHFKRHTTLSATPETPVPVAVSNSSDHLVPTPMPSPFSSTIGTPVSLDNTIQFDPGRAFFRTISGTNLTARRRNLVLAGAETFCGNLHTPIAGASVSVCLARLVPPTCNLSAAPVSIPVGSSSTLTLTVSGTATSSIIAGTPYGPTGGSKVVSPIVTTAYIGSVTGPGGTSFCTRTVFVTPPPSPPPTCTIAAAPPIIVLGGTSTLTMTTTGSVTSATLDGTPAPPFSKLVSPSVSTLYFGTVAGPGGSASCSTTVTVTIPPPPPPTCTLTAAPSTITAGSNSTLTLTTSGSAFTSVLDGTSFPASGGIKVVTPATTTNYLASVSGPGGTGNCSVSVTVNPLVALSCSITATPNPVMLGSSTTLTLTTTGAATSSILDGLSLPGSGGTKLVTPALVNLYNGSVSGVSGTSTCSLSVTVTPPAAPTCTLVASPSTIISGESATLTMVTTGSATSSTLDGTGVAPAGGTKIVTPISTTTYSASTTGPGGTTTCTATVTVQPPPGVCEALTLPPAGSLSVTTISTAAQLNSMTSNRHYRLANDVVLTGNWTPLPGVANMVLDGAGHTIRNLTIDVAFDEAGLFRHLSSSAVINLDFENVNIKGHNRVGTIAGVASRTWIDNVSVITPAMIRGVSDVGGIVGTTLDDVIGPVTRFGTKITNSTVNGFISYNSLVSGLPKYPLEAHGYMGGAVGNSVNELCLKQVIFSGSVDGYLYGSVIGGLVGFTGGIRTGNLFSVLIENSSAEGMVRGDRTLGGLIGQSGISDICSIPRKDRTITVRRSRFSGTVYGYAGSPLNPGSGGIMGISVIDDHCGGTVTQTIENSYALGDISGGPPTGGLIGGASIDGSLVLYNSYYSGILGYLPGAVPYRGLIGQLTGPSTSVGWTATFWNRSFSGTGPGPLVRTTAEMQTASTFTSQGWDFTAIWKISPSQYPRLMWEP